MSNPKLKGLILAAGHGTRLRPITSLRPKPTIPVANKQLIHYAVDNLVEAGVEEIGIVVSYDTIDYLKKSLDNYGKARFEYIIQDPPLGLAHAVAVSREFLGDSPFVMYLGDNLFQQGIKQFVDAFRPEEGVNSVLALVRVEDPRQFGVAIVENNRVVNLVEKPKDPPSDLAIAGVYVFDSSIHDAIEGLQPGAKDEYQITDAIQRLIERDYNVAPVVVGGWWKDTGNPEDILDANRLQLDRATRDIKGEVIDSEIEGAVVVEPGAVIRRSTIRGPAHIGEGTVIEDSTIGAYTTVGDQCTVKKCDIEYSVIGAGTVLEKLSKPLRSSLIGEEVVLQGNGNEHYSLVVGDKSQLSLE